MELSQKDRANLVRYLLGQLSEQEEQVLEEAIFSDQANFYQLCEIEDQLIDGYARNQLQGADRRDFEQHYLGQPARRDRVKFASTLTAEFDRTKPAIKGEWWQSFFDSLRQPTLIEGVGFATLLFFAVAAWWLTSSRTPKIEDLAQNGGTIREPQTNASPTPTSSPAQSATPDPPPTVSTPIRPATLPATITLTAITLRGEEQETTETLRLTSSQRTTQIRVRLTDQDYPLYRAHLQTSSGQLVKDWQVKPARSGPDQSLLLTLSAHQLATGNYRLILEGRSSSQEIEPICKLSFKVLKI